jgi:hypothetical protein
MAADLEQLQGALMRAHEAGDASAAKVLAAEILRQRGVKSPKDIYNATQQVNDPLIRSAQNFAEDMPLSQQIPAGVGKAIVDTGRGAGQLVGAVSREDVAKAREQDAPLMKTPGGLGGNIGGNIGMALLPGGAVKAAGLALKAPGISAVGGSMLAPRTISGAAAVGVPMGLVQPSTSTKETLQNILSSGVGSTAAPALVRAGGAVKAAAEPLYEAGQKKIIGRLLNKVAGDEAGKAQTSLRGATELVPGSSPTAGQAAGNSGIAALERTASAINPETGVAYGRRAVQQNEARVGALKEVAGADGEKAFTEAMRSQAGRELYGKAFTKGIDPKRITPEVKQEMKTLLSNPYIEEAQDTARKLAAGDGIAIKGKEGSLEGLHYLKIALDDQIGVAARSDSKVGAQQLRQLMETKDKLMGFMQRVSPEYQKAVSEYQALSKPLNQMKTAEEIGNKSIDKLTGNLTPKAYANALTDTTAQRATGFGGATLENTMEPSNLARLQAIKEDLARAHFAQNAGRGAGSDTIQKLAYSNFVDAAGVPTFLRNLGPAQVAGNVAARGADALYGRANKEISQRLAEIMLNPKDAADVMRLAATPGGQRLLELATRGGSGAGLLAAPALLNAQKQ